MKVSVECADGYHGKPKAKPCFDESEPYELVGCEKSLYCTKPEDTTGYTVKEKALTAHDFKADVTCAEGYAGEPKVEPCSADQAPYTLSGCEKVILCLTPENTEGYEVTENSLEKGTFSVSAKCGLGYIGEAQVKACADGVPYALRGCEPDRRTCGVPEDTTGYALQAKSLQIFNFEVKAGCAEGFSGSPSVEVCTAQGEAFKVSGCSKTVSCQSPVDQRGYAVTETSKEVNGFKVEATCASGYYGEASVTPCAEGNTPYVLDGCKFRKWCKAPKDSEGYEVTETNMQLHKFGVTATCGKGFIGKAKVTPCADNSQEYRLSGCKAIAVCQSPKDTKGYVVNEISLAAHEFQVSVECAPGYAGKPQATGCGDTQKRYFLSGCYKDGDYCQGPADSTGYLLTENELAAKTFDVVGQCTPSHEGKAKVIPCSSNQKEYHLTGCRPKVSCMSDAAAEGYDVTETDLYILPFQFDVKATCKSGYVGTAAVTPCDEPNEAYVLSGCTKDNVVCKRPTTTEGYTVKENSLTQSLFDVTAECEAGYKGSATVIACSPTGGDYILAGCKKVEKCLSPPNADGYKLDEVDLRMDRLMVHARCSDGNLGRAVISPCEGHGKPYKLSGCNLVRTCTAPLDSSGYVVSEVSTHIHDFEVAAKCAKGFVGTAVVSPCTTRLQPYKLQGCTKDPTCVSPGDVSGYKLDERSLWKSNFDVSATCVEGYTGKAHVEACSESGKPYVLNGCKKA